MYFCLDSGKSILRILDDQEINVLLTDVKHLPTNWRRRLQPRPKSHFRFSECDFQVQSVSGHSFRIVIRTNRINFLDFSIILIFEDSEQDYRLLRCNGMHQSRHTHLWEKQHGLANAQFDPAFHIHRATERYQLSGFKIDGYAEVTTAYADFNEALDIFLAECGFQEPSSDQGRLF